MFNIALLTVFLLSIMNTQNFFHYNFTLIGGSSNYLMNFQNFFIAQNINETDMILIWQIKRRQILLRPPGLCFGILVSTGQFLFLTLSLWLFISQLQFFMKIDMLSKMVCICMYLFSFELKFYRSWCYKKLNNTFQRILLFILNLWYVSG